ncbi:MAG: hypothetical protein DBX47_07475 [Clostridiales bacterium]|nr:MAG: hypothetical protein DBX47_07475 [Clostridiales bacterium]
MIFLKKIFRDALTLGFSNAVVTGAGFLFSLYLSRVLGTEGVGLYQLVLSVYVLSATFATSGISLSVTRLVSEALSFSTTKGEVRKIMRRCFAFSALVGLSAGVLLFSLSVPAASSFLKKAETVECFRILACGLMFMSLCSCFHGYFIGVRRASKSAAASIVEDFSKIAVVVLAFTIKKPENIVVGCEVICIALVLSEFFSCICSFVLYLVDKNRKGGKTPQNTVSRLLKIAVPVATSSYLRSGLTTLENVLIPIGLVKAGFSESEALSLFGSMKGLVLPLLFFPAAFLWAFTKVLVPEVTKAFTQGNSDRINSIGARVIKTTLLCSLPIMIFFIAFSQPIGKYIFKSADAGNYLFLLAPLVPMMYLDGVVDAVLKGMNEQVAVMRYNIIEAAVRVFLVWVVLPLTGFEGLVLTIYAGNVINAVLSLRRLCKLTNISKGAYKLTKRQKY